MASVRLALAVSLALTATGCATAALPCASSLACGEGMVCGADGRCGALPIAGAAGSSEHHAPRRWAITGAGHPRALGGDRDRAALGGADDGALWLAFDPVGPGVIRALVVLGPVDAASRRARETLVIARRVSDGAEIARARLLPGAARPVVLDVSDHAAGGLEITVRATAPLALATPVHLDPRSRPRLETWREAR